MYDFTIKRPTDLQRAVALLDGDAQILAGGQTLIPTLKARLAAPEILISLSDIPELRGTCIADDGAVCIGAMTTHNAVAAGAAAHIPALADLAGQIGDPAVRNRGTIGGSLANNDPSACYPAAALALNARLLTQNRCIAADDCFLGLFETALAPDEILAEIQFPIPQRAAYVKFAQPASRFALVGVFVACVEGAVRVAVTGASENGVFRWLRAEEKLQSDFTDDALQRLNPPDDADMISDIHASGAYRAHLVKVVTKRAVKAALA